MKTRKKIIGALLIATVLMGTSKTCLAVSTSFNLTENLATGKFDYGRYGVPIGIQINFTEKHKSTKQDYSDTYLNTVVGNTTSIHVSRASDEGYKYTRATFYTLVNGKVFGNPYPTIP